MSFEVLAGNLRAAGGRYRSVAEELGTEPVKLTGKEPDTVGHIELTAWLKAVVEQCQNAHTALREGATGIADGLDVAAHHYETTDDSVASQFQSNPLLGGAGSPFAPWGTTAPSPLFGPPAPGASSTPGAQP